MKKNILLPILFASILGTATAQRVILKTYIERTHAGPKLGTAIGFENNHMWEYGAFFQESSLMDAFMLSEEQRASLPRLYERNFAGIYFAVPMIVRDKFLVKGNVRTGLSNNENFVITPSVTTDYMPVKYLRFGMGVGTRAFRPTFQASASVSF